MGQEFDE